MVKVESMLTFVALLNNVLIILHFSNFLLYCTGFSVSTIHNRFAVRLIGQLINNYYIASTPSFVNNVNVMFD